MIGRARRSASGEDESILVVLVPEAEGAVAEFRARLDPAATMPAHVTVLYPFVRPGSIGPELLAHLDDLFGAVPAFEFALREVRWFDQRVVYVAPDPDTPFIELTRAVVAAYPGHPPYRGEFADVVPHVCVAQGAALTEMTAAARAVEARLPVSARVTEVCLMRHEAAARRWHLVRAFPLRTA